MNLRQLSCFVAVAEEGSFTRAAERIGIAQPSLSQQVRGLEAELGGLLLERLARGIVLTPAGRSFLPEAQAAIRAAERAERSARAALGLSAGELAVAAVRSIAVGILPEPLRVWHERYPDVTIRLHEYRNKRVLEDDVRRGTGDIAVGPRPADWTGPIVPLGWEQFVIVLPATDALAGRDTLRLRELADRSWVLFESDFGLAEVVAGACARAGFQPRAAVRTAQSEAAARLAAAGLGPAMVPDNILPPGLAASVSRLDPPVSRELVAYTRSEWSPAARTFLEVLRAGTSRWSAAPPETKRAGAAKPA
jgi:DNA-binding transcriptional LysR family regulator